MLSTMPTISPPTSAPRTWLKPPTIAAMKANRPIDFAIGEFRQIDREISTEATTASAR